MKLVKSVQEILIRYWHGRPKCSCQRVQVGCLNGCRAGVKWLINGIDMQVDKMPSPSRVVKPTHVCVPVIGSLRCPARKPTVAAEQFGPKATLLGGHEAVPIFEPQLRYQR